MEKAREKAKITDKDIIAKIKRFYADNGRIPFKMELEHYNVARNKFGTWNNAIIASGFKPNPVMFAEKHTANDGHKCDSLTEKIIDDWLTSHKIKHKRSISYPHQTRLTCDFVVKNYFIEFFGLENEHKKYTKLVNKKRQLAKQYNLNLVEVKPAHIFPKNKLGEVLKFLIK